jgi:hypothetical protein
MYKICTYKIGNDDFGLVGGSSGREAILNQETHLCDGSLMRLGMPVGWRCRGMIGMTFSCGGAHTTNHKTFCVKPEDFATYGARIS